MANNYFLSAGAQPIHPVVSSSAPATPTGLKISILKSDFVTPSWDFTAGADSFKLERATVSGGPFSTVSGASTVAALFFKDTSVAANTTYFYRIIATNGDGDSAASAEVETKTLPDNLPILDRAEIDLKDLITGMTIAGGFNFDWDSSFNRRDLAKVGFPTVSEMDWEPEEDNIDDEEGAHAEAYSNILTMRLLAVGKLTTQPTNPKDAIRTTTTKMLDDLKQLFGINYQLSEQTGIYSIMYDRSERVDHGSGDIQKAFHLETFWNIRYIQSRVTPAEAG